MIDRLAAWLAAADWIERATGIVLAITAWLLLGIAAWALLHLARRSLRGSDYRSHNDQVMAQRISRLEDRPEAPQPGTDIGLYLDCIAVFGDCDELDRLRDAIQQHRKENPQP